MTSGQMTAIVIVFFIAIAIMSNRADAAQCNFKAAYKGAPYYTTCNSVTLPDVIESSYRMTPLYHALRTAKGSITMYLSGFGGSGQALVNMTTAIQSNPNLKVHAVVGGNLYSAHSHLLCLADTIDIDKNITVMYHNGMMRTDPNAAKAYQQIMAHRKQHKWLLDICVKRGLLSKSEANDVLNGKDVYKTYSRI